jgi:hypothetical protein
MSDVAKCDVKTLERLADQLASDAKTVRGLNVNTMLNIADIIRAAIGAPLMWPSREAGAAEADRLFPDSSAARHQFNWGVKWAVDQYHDLNIGQVRFRGERTTEQGKTDG